MNIDRNSSMRLELFRPVCRLTRLFLAFGLLLVALSAQAVTKPPYPVIFIHGINESASDWYATLLASANPLMKGWTYGGTPVVDRSDTVCDLNDINTNTHICSGDSLGITGDFYTLQFSSNNHLTFGEQAGELAAIIRKIESLTGQLKVILVAHSMGGLAARAYLEGRAWTRHNVGQNIPYGGDVAKLVTVGTPNLGSDIAVFCQSFKHDICMLFDQGEPSSVAMSSLRPESGALKALNSSISTLPPDVSYRSIVVIGANSPFYNYPSQSDGDGIVTEASQDLASLTLPDGFNSYHHRITVRMDPTRCKDNPLALTGSSRLETHTCEQKDPSVQAYISSEILSTPLATIPVVIPPGATTLPPNSATISNTSATLRGRIDPVGKSSSAWFEWGVTTALGNSSYVQNLIAGTAVVEISQTVFGLGNNVKYYYRAVANNADGTTGGDILSFTTPAVGVVSLPAPSLFTPTPLAWSQSTTPSFSWSPVANAPSYRIMVAIDPKALPTDRSSTTCTGCAINATSSTPNYVPSAGMLSPGTLYWWQVKGRGATEYGNWSAKQAFATALAPTVQLPAPALTAPINGNTTASASPLMSWTTVSGADSYWIMVADNPADLPTASDSLTCPLCSVNDISYTNSYTPASGKLVSGRTYYWQVKARNSTTSGTWSSPVGTFITGGVPAPTDAACGAAAGSTFTSMPSGSLCSTGTPSAVSGVGPWFWSCSANGHDQNCLANIQTYTVSTSATGSGTITPASETINLGSAATFAIAPRIGSKASVSGCGISQSWIASPTIVTTSSITSGCTVTATFTPNPATRFSKVCNNGQEAGQGSCPAAPVLGSGAADWACTRDNNNGLLWEVKTGDGGLRDKYNTYSWYDANPANNGGNLGTRNGGVCVGSRCDTSGFADAVSATGLCGANDWRMPTHDELVTLVDETSANSGLPAVDGNYFPNTLGAPYWSGSPYNGISIADVFGTSNAAWEVNFFYQFADGTYPRAWDNRVRLVRGGDIGGPFDLTVSLAGSGSVTSIPAGINCGSTCRESVSGGSSVTLTAMPNAGYSFGGWSGACTGTDTTCTVAMSQYREVTATFSSLAVNGACGGANGGLYPVAPIGSQCSTGTPSTLSGSGPWYWSCSGSGGGSTASCSAYPTSTTLPSIPITGFGSGLSVGSGPYGIAAGPDGNLWFTESNGNRIGRITPAGVVTEFSTGISPGASPMGIAAGPDGNLWFTEAGPDRIGRITPTGVVTEFSITSGATPTRIVAGPDGNLWFTENGFARIGRITPSGVLTEFSLSANGFAQDITAGPDGNLWFTETSINRIGRITPAGAVTEFSTGVSPGAYPMGIAAGPDGNVWFTEAGGRIGRITPAGVVTEFSSGILAGSGSNTIAAGSDGNLWFPQVGGSPEIGRITPAGAVTEFNFANANVTAITAGPDGNLWFAASAQNLIGRIAIGGGGGAATAVSLSKTLPFSAQVGMASAAQSVTLSNTGSALLNIGSIVANGDFAQSSGCSPTLPAGSSCTMSVTFNPTSAGPRNGNLTITSDAVGSPHLVSLSGTGIAVALPEVSLSSTSLSFAAQNVGTGSTAQTVALTNPGGATLNVTSIAASGDFAVTNNCGGGLGAGGTCNLSVTFTPTVAGVRTGAITITSNAAGSPHTLALSGGLVAPVTTSLDLAPGWNLVGNGTDAAVDVVTNFGDATKVATVWKWIAPSLRWAFYAPSLQGQALADYAATKGYDVLTTINGGEGFWVNASQAFTKTLPGGTTITGNAFQAGQPYALKPGWNLVAIDNTLTPNAFNVGLSVVPPSAGVVPINLTTLWAWDNPLAKWYFYAPNLEALSGSALTNYITSKGYLDFTANNKTLGPGVGFWVNKP